jgi:glycopeptide antibiotics resistance protein
VVVARFTFFPFEMPEGRVQPLLLDPAQVYPFRINLTPLVHLMAYPEARSAWLNLIGNTAMFIPVGVVWPAVFRELRAPLRGLAAGMGFSLCIELLQLPFFDRVSDVDDLILNGLGYAIGYGLYSLVHRWMKRRT